MTERATSGLNYSKFLHDMAPQQVSPSKAELIGFLFKVKKYSCFLMTNKGDFQSILHSL